MEFYWSYANYKDGMKLVEELYKKIAVEVFGKQNLRPADTNLILRENGKRLIIARR